MKDFKVVDLYKAYGVKTLLDGVSFTIRQGEHVGLIGQNGTGKSSLLAILSGEDTADKGIIEKANDFRIGYLKQEPVLNNEDTVFESVYNGNAPLLQVVKQYEQAVTRLSQDVDNEQLQKDYERAEAQMSQKDAWQFDVLIKTILTKLGITDLQQTIKTLSGGQKKRVGLAQILIEEPDLLLLDEPTNHLDYESIEWLENYLATYKGSLLLVTHDRYFLERITQKMLELSHGKIEVYEGNYCSYIEQKAERTAIHERMATKLDRLYASELAWMRKGAKARTIKQQARIDRFKTIEEQVKNRTKDDELSLIMTGSRLGKKVFVCEHVKLSIGNKIILNDFNYIVQTQERIGIVGANGVGKSTFLNALAGQLAFDSGVFQVGETVKIAYYKQGSDDVPEDKRVVAYLQEIVQEVDVANGQKMSVTDLLEMFLFPRYMHGSLIGSLSGGERRRLYLLKLLLNQPNVLLLDEPTNDLDIATLQVLENYIEQFSGAVIVVSHDRYFLDKVVDKLIIFDGLSHYTTFIGNMSDYSKSVQKVSCRSGEKATTKKKQSNIEKQSPKKMTYHEMKEWETIEDTITNIESEISVVQNKMVQHANNFEALQQLQQQLDELEQILLEKMARWEYLSECHV